MDYGENIPICKGDYIYNQPILIKKVRNHYLKVFIKQNETKSIFV